MSNKKSPFSFAKTGISCAWCLVCGVCWWVRIWEHWLGRIRNWGTGEADKRLIELAGIPTFSLFFIWTFNFYDSVLNFYDSIYSVPIEDWICSLYMEKNFLESQNLGNWVWAPLPSAAVCQRPTEVFWQIQIIISKKCGCCYLLKDIKHLEGCGNPCVREVSGSQISAFNLAHKRRLSRGQRPWRSFKIMVPPSRSV